MTFVIMSLGRLSRLPGLGFLSFVIPWEKRMINFLAFLRKAVLYLWDVLTNRSVKIYVGCKITNAPEDFSLCVKGLKARLEKHMVHGRKIEVFDFLGKVLGTSPDVYKWDIWRCVRRCHFFVAVATHESTGLGYELGTAIERYGKPVLGLAYKDPTQTDLELNITRLVKGIDDPRFTLQSYTTLDEIEHDIVTWVEGQLLKSRWYLVKTWFKRKWLRIEHLLWTINKEAEIKALRAAEVAGTASLEVKTA
jgi:hypothetical protein